MKSQIGLERGGIFEIFDTDDFSTKKYFITKRHVESLGPDSNWIKMIELDHNDEPVNLNVSNEFPIRIFHDGIVEIQEKDGPRMVSKTRLPDDQLTFYSGGGKRKKIKRKTKKKRHKNKKKTKKRKN